MANLSIIGIGYLPLSNRGRDRLHAAEYIFASERLLEVFRSYNEYASVRNRIKVINNVDETIAFIQSRISESPATQLVLLASGDPLFFGIGRRAVQEFGKDAVEIMPDLSSIQMAFSRIREPWDNAFLMSLHGGPDPAKRRRLKYELTEIPQLISQHEKIAVLTDRQNNPTAIAHVLSSMSKDLKITMYVCEKLGYPEEKVSEGSPEELSGLSFSDPNVVIIINTKECSSSFPSVGNPSELSCIKKKDCGQAEMTDKNTASQHACKFGLNETEIIHSRGLITKDEVRAVTIHKLRLPNSGVFWDIGAGSGSVSVEAARLYPGLKVFSVEKDEQQLANISENAERFGTTNLMTVRGSAPDVLTGLPAPDRVFIGGSSDSLKQIISAVSKAISEGGIIVVNATTIETLNAALVNLDSAGLIAEVFEISVSRSKVIGGKRHMSAMNPVFIIRGQKGK